MSHDLNYNEGTGKHSFFSVKEKAWHGLGQIIDKYPTSAEAIQHAGLDYIVEKRPLFTYDTANHIGDPDEEIIIPEIEVPNYFATVRADTEQVLGVVGRDYEVIQNRDAFNFFDSIVGGGSGIMYETAGALGNGERIFITAKLPGFIQVGKDDLIEKYLFLTTSHDGLGSITAAFTPIRIVCANTLSAAQRNMENVVRIRHTENATERLTQAHKIMGISNKIADNLNDLFNHWAKIRITDKQLIKLVEQAMSPKKEVMQNEEQADQFSTVFKNKIEKISEYAFSNPTQQGATTKGTLFGAYNAITGYYQNVKEYKSGEAKLKNIMFGGAQQRTQKTFDLCTAFAKEVSYN